MRDKSLKKTVKGVREKSLNETVKEMMRQQEEERMLPPQGFSRRLRAAARGLNTSPHEYGRTLGIPARWFALAPQTISVATYEKLNRALLEAEKQIRKQKAAPALQNPQKGNEMDHFVTGGGSKALSTPQNGADFFKTLGVLAQTQGFSSAVQQTAVQGTMVLERYEVKGVLGAGGMGMVLLVHDQWMNNDCAMKVLPPEIMNANTVSRFTREFKALQALNHSGIVKSYSYNRSEGFHFYTMEYIKGLTLQERISTDCEEEWAAETLIKICAPLAYAHSKNIIHRDLKPGNIMLASSGEEVKIVDFGIAKALATTSNQTELTQMAVGTPFYWAPEQYEGGEITFATDMYALGVMAYLMFTGKLPSGRFKDPSHFGLSHLDDLILPLLEPHAQDRKYSAEAFAEALRKVYPKKNFFFKKSHDSSYEKEPHKNASPQEKEIFSLQAEVRGRMGVILDTTRIRDESHLSGDAQNSGRYKARNALLEQGASAQEFQSNGTVFSHKGNLFYQDYSDGGNYQFYVWENGKKYEIGEPTKAKRTFFGAADEWIYSIDTNGSVIKIHARGYHEQILGRLDVEYTGIDFGHQLLWGDFLLFTQGRRFFQINRFSGEIEEYATTPALTNMVEFKGKVYFITTEGVFNVWNGVKLEKFSFSGGIPSCCGDLVAWEAKGKESIEQEGIYFFQVTDNKNFLVQARFDQEGKSEVAEILELPPLKWTAKVTITPEGTLVIMYDRTILGVSPYHKDKIRWEHQADEMIPCRPISVSDKNWEMVYASIDGRVCEIDPRAGSLKKTAISSKDGVIRLLATHSQLVQVPISGTVTIHPFQR